MRALWFVPALLLGCADNARWSTEPGESWCGSVTAASFVRAGMHESTRLRLELDAERLQSAPGRVWTTAFDSGERLAAADLRVIPQMLHDPLSTLNFGEGRVKNALAIVDVPSVDAARPATQLLVVVSLLQSGDVEVRLIRGASPGTATTVNIEQLFGVFHMKREKGDCGVR
ncbi:MAG: hypothetical protein HYV09_39555 [Deltaproteobacteria bacterium]|nr:hypothetical protein [Deltaproteobacteria bacterium]